MLQSRRIFGSWESKVLLSLSTLPCKSIPMSFVFLIHSVFATTDIFDTYVLQTSMKELEIQKKVALEKTIKSADWLYQFPLQMRLKDKPHICSTYVFETKDSFFRVTCDSLEPLTIPTSGKREKVQRKINGQIDEIEVIFYNNEYVAYEIFSGQGSMYIEIHTDDSSSSQTSTKTLTVSKAIKSSHFSVPYVVEMTYVLSP